MHYILRGGRTRSLLLGIFCTLFIIYGFVPPCGALMRPLPLRCSATGKAEPFFYSRQLRTNQSVMHYTEKTCSNGIVEPHKTRTPTKRVHTKKKLLEYLSVEENAKNKAYYYIISSGNLEQFTNFCKQLPDGIDYGAACTAALILQFFNPQKTTL